MCNIMKAMVLNVSNIIMKVPNGAMPAWVYLKCMFNELLHMCKIRFEYY